MMENTLDQKPDSVKPDPVDTLTTKAVKMGAAIGLFAGWMIGLIWVLAVLPPRSFGEQSTADLILAVAPVAGAAAGAGIGWLLRDFAPFARLALAPWAARMGYKRGWKVGTVVGLLLAQFYFPSHSPLGFYTGSILLVFELIVPPCAALGAAIGALVFNDGDDVVPPAPSDGPGRKS